MIELLFDRILASVCEAQLSLCVKKNKTYPNFVHRRITWFLFIFCGYYMKTADCLSASSYLLHTFQIFIFLCKILPVAEDFNMHDQTAGAFFVVNLVCIDIFTCFRDKMQLDGWRQDLRDVQRRNYYKPKEPPSQSMLLKVSFNSWDQIKLLQVRGVNLVVRAL